MILVVGSTGILGSEICSTLARKGIPMRVMVRHTSDLAKREQFRKFGADIAFGDLRYPATLAAACQGIDGVICTATALTSFQNGANDFQLVDRQGVEDLIDASESAGVSRFILVSFSGSIDFHFPLLDARRATEQHLRESELTYTILRPAFLMETWFAPGAGFDPHMAKASLYGTGMHPIHWISARSVAQFAANCIYRPISYNTTLDLAGPEALSQREVVKIFEEASERPFETTAVPYKALQASCKTGSDVLSRSWAGLCLAVARGDRPAEPAFEHMLTVRSFAEAVYGKTGAVRQRAMHPRRTARAYHEPTNPASYEG